VARKHAQFCGAVCAGAAKAANRALVTAARRHMAKAHDVNRQRYFERAVGRVRVEAARLVAELSVGEACTQMAVAKVLLAVEQRGYRRGWCARDKRARTATVPAPPKETGR